jgi:hypothetical protein
VLFLSTGIVYARSSTELLTCLIREEVQEGWKFLFHTPLMYGYDALIEIIWPLKANFIKGLAKLFFGFRWLLRRVDF